MSHSKILGPTALAIVVCQYTPSIPHPPKSITRNSPSSHPTQGLLPLLVDQSHTFACLRPCAHDVHINLGCDPMPPQPLNGCLNTAEIKPLPYVQHLCLMIHY